jgi:hypothetical protein
MGLANAHSHGTDEFAIFVKKLPTVRTVIEEAFHSRLHLRQG